MIHEQPDIEIGFDQLKAIELAAIACGRLSATVESAGGAASDFLLVRHAVRVHDGTANLAAELLLAQESTEPTAVSVEMEQVGRGYTGTPHDNFTHPSSVLRASVVAGQLVAEAPASAEAQRRAALAGALALVHGGTLPAPWVAPWQLDASARSAAVQIDRSASWGEWIRVWCQLLAREAGTTEQSLRSATAQLEAERAHARAQHRVGGTDADVLVWLQTHRTFTIRSAGDSLGLTRPTVGTAIERLESLGFATELTGRRRDRIWVSATLLALAGSR